jgi:hypothetical protein
MRRLNMLIVMTAMVFVAAGSARGITSPGPLMLGSRAVAASALSSLPAVKADESLSQTILPAAPNFTVGQLFVVASAEDGEKEKNPPPRSKACPPDKDKDKDKKDIDKKGGDSKDKDQNDDCGKGTDSKLP